MILDKIIERLLKIDRWVDIDWTFRFCRKPYMKRIFGVSLVMNDRIRNARLSLIIFFWKPFVIRHMAYTLST